MAKKNPSPKRSGKKSSRYERFIFWGIVAAALAIALLLWGPLHKASKPTARKQASKKISTSHKPEKQKEQPSGSGGITAVVAIVIDDMGQDLHVAQDVLALPEPITFAIMPRLPFSRKTADLARTRGREVLVHLPMEAKNHMDKRRAQGTLTTSMTPMEFISVLNDNIDSVPGAVGINNHEGSALTENRQAMTFLMSELKKRGLFFLDSMTSSNSTALAVAKEFGLKTAKRDVFLDNDVNSADAIRRQLSELAKLAQKNGSAVGIGHPHPVTIAELKRWLPEAAELGIEVVPISRLMQ